MTRRWPVTGAPSHRGAGPQVCGIDRVGEQHRDGHRTQTAGHRGDPAGTLGRTLELDIAHEFAGSAAVDPHVEYRGPGSDPDPGDEAGFADRGRSEEHTSELQSRLHLVCRLLLENKTRSSPHHAR